MGKLTPAQLRLKRGTIRHPRRDGMEERVAQFAREHHEIRDVYLAVVPDRRDPMTYAINVEVASDVVNYSWPTRRQMYYAALMQADRMEALLQRHGVRVWRSRGPWDAAFSQ